MENNYLEKWRVINFEIEIKFSSELRKANCEIREKL